MRRPSKRWAYVTEFGFDLISAWAIKQERAALGGGPLGITYWSTHRQGERRKLKHVGPPGVKPHFAYSSDGLETHEGDGGESLTHVLFKRAIARLSKTQLRFPTGEVHDIRITHAELEKNIPLKEGYRVVDVYCKFESDGNLAKKWGGEVCFEVWHTHQAPPVKIKGLMDKRVPVVEVKVSEFFQYRHEDKTTDALQEKHVDFLVERLGEYMLGKAISDPSSVEYLEEKMQIMTAQMARDAKLAVARSDEVKMLQSELGRIKRNNTTLAQDNAELASQIASLTTERALLKKAAGENANIITRLGGANQDLSDENRDLRNALKYRKYQLIGAGVAFVVCLVWLLWISFVGGRTGNDPVSLGTANEQKGAFTAKTLERTDPLPEPNKGRAVKHKASAKKIIKKERPLQEDRAAPTATSEPSAK